MTSIGRFAACCCRSQELSRPHGSPNNPIRLWQLRSLSVIRDPGIHSVITTHDLTKKYGEQFAIRSIELDLQEGDLFGFIGPNGAGKTTTMRIIATLLNPTWGEAYVCGNSIYTKPKEIRRLVGYMPDFFGVYDDMKVIEYLEFFAAAYRIRGAARRQRCDEMLDIVDLDFKRDAYASTLSRGQTQRLGLARVLLHDPQVLLLDEPLSGLDPRARIEMRNLLRRLGQMGKTIIVSSHILPELADICNKVGIIDRGVMTVNAEVATVMKQVRQRTILNVKVANDTDSAAKLLGQHAGVDSVVTQNGKLVVTLHQGIEDYSDLPTLLVQAGYRLTLFQEEEVNLESAFMALTKGMGAKT
jgi:ABC-2 type transport system ATP-binding protein